MNNVDLKGDSTISVVFMYYVLSVSEYNKKPFELHVKKCGCCVVV